MSDEVTPPKPSGNSLNQILHQATPFGNYHNYYFHREPSIPDVRLKLLDTTLFKNKRILDLGANAGKISIESLVYLGASSVKGIDIDEYLITQAKEISQKELAGKDELGRIEFECVDFMTEDGYFENITQQFDTILLLSITKWLHLNHGDEGLKNLFESLFNCLPSGGTLVVEPQEWENYVKAVKKNKILKPMFKTITIRPPFIEELQNVGFKLEANIERIEGGFSRPLLVWRKN